MSRYEERNGLLVPSRRILAPELALKITHLRGFNRRRPVVGGIAYVDSNETLNTGTATPPDGLSTDLIIGMAFDDTIIPTLPALWNGIFTISAGSAAQVRVGWKVHSGGTESSYTWTNARGVVYALYSGVDLVSPIGDNDHTNTNTTTWTCPAKTITAPTSWVIWGVNAASTPQTGSWPSDMTLRQDGDPTGAGPYQYGDTNGPVSVFNSRTRTLSVSDRAASFSIELLAD